MGNLTRSKKIRIALASVIMGLIIIIDGSLLKYYTDIVGLQATIYGKVISVIGFIGIFNGVWVGIFTDVKAKYTQVLRGIPPIMALMAMGLLLIQPSWDQVVVYASMFAFMLIYEICKMLYTVNITVYMFNVTDNSKDRTEISVWRSYFGFIPAGMASFIPILLLTGDYSRTVVMGVYLTCIIVGLIITEVSLLGFKNSDAKKAENQEPVRLKDIGQTLKLVVSSRYYIFYLLTAIILTAVSYIYYPGYLYFVDNVLNVSGVYALIPDFAGALVQVVVYALAIKLVAKNGIRNTLVYGVVVTLCAYLGLFFFRSYGAVVVFYAMVMVGFACFWSLQPPLLGLIVDLNEIETGKRKAGTLGATFGLIAAPANSLMMLLFSSLLEFVNYDGATKVQTAETVAGLRWIISGIPVIFLSLAIIVLICLPLNKKEESRITETIRTMRSNQEDTE